MQGDKCKNGILSSIKILPLIPPSPKSFANSVILSQIFPNIFGDGYNKAPNEENSIYDTVKTLLILIFLIKFQQKNNFVHSMI